MGLNIDILPCPLQQAEEVDVDFMQDFSGLRTHGDTVLVGADEAAGRPEGLPEVAAGDQGHEEAGCRVPDAHVVVRHQEGLHPHMEVAQGPGVGILVTAHLRAK